MDANVLLVRWKKPNGHWSKRHIIRNEQSVRTICGTVLPPGAFGHTRFERSVERVDAIVPLDMCGHCHRENGSGELFLHAPKTSSEPMDEKEIEEAVAQIPEWECPNCGTKNLVSYLNCHECGRPAPNAEPANGTEIEAPAEG